MSLCFILAVKSLSIEYCILQFTGEKKFFVNFGRTEIIFIFLLKFELSGEFLSRGQEKWFDLTNIHRVIGGSSYRVIFVRKY